MEPITLGELIKLLEQRPQDQVVVFDFRGLVPDYLESYCGCCEDLALGCHEYELGGCKDVAALLERLRSAVGNTFKDHKGGSHIVHEGTRMWAANYGESDGTAIIGIANCEYQTVIETRFCS